MILVREVDMARYQTYLLRFESSQSIGKDIPNGEPATAVPVVAVLMKDPKPAGEGVGL